MKEKINKMDIRDMANDFVPQTSKNVTELEVLNILHDITTKECQDSKGKTFTVNEIVVDEETYRVPTSVIGQIKEILKVKPDTVEVKVTKKGEGLATKYQVIPM